MRYSDEELIHAYNESNTLLEILQKFDLFPAGVNYKKIKEEFVRLGLPISKFWNSPCKRTPPRKLEELFKKDIKITSHTFKQRLLKHGYFEHKCYKCNLTKWNEKPIPIELEHINGDRLDNRLENLTILCPNCHAQTDTYRAKNVSTRHLGRPVKPKNKTKRTITLTRRKKSNEIAQQHLEFITKNAEIESLSNIAKKIGVSRGFLSDFCKQNKIKVVKKTYLNAKRNIKVHFTKDYLEREIQLRSIASIAKENKVAHKTVRKWCCKFGVDIKKAKFAHKKRQINDSSLIKIIEKNKNI